MANSSTVSSGDLATATQYNNLRADILDTSSGHIHDGTNARSDGQFSLAVSGLPMIIENTTDAVSSEVLRLRGDNATRADGDEIFMSFYLDDSGGNSTEFARITAEAVDVTDGSEDGQLRFGVAVADGTMTDVFTINSSTGGATSVSYEADSFTIKGEEGGAGILYLMADQGDDAGDEWKINIADGGVMTFGNDIASAGTFVSFITVTPHATTATSSVAFVGDVTVGDDLSLTSDSSVFNMGAGNDFTITHDGTTGATLAGTPITVNSTGALTLDSSTDITLDADGADVFLKDGGTLFGTLTNSSGELVIKSSSSGTTAATFSGANVTFAGTIGSGAITSTGIVTGTGFTAGSAVLAEAELELLDGLTAGTAIASKVVTTDANIDTSGQRNLTITGELDAATLDLSSSADIAGDLVLSGGADGALQFTNAGENSIKIPDNQASALIIEEANNAYITFVTTNSSEAITVAKATTFSAGIADSGTIAAGTWNGTDIGVAYGGTGASSLTDGGVLLGSGTGAVTAMAVLADSEMIVGDGTTDPVAESGATLRTSIGVGTGNNVEFAAITGTTIDATTDFTIGDTVITNGTITDSSGLTIAAAVDLGSNTLTTTGSLQVRTIDYSDGDVAMTIADGGNVTFAGSAIVTGDVQITSGSLNVDTAVDADVTVFDVLSSGQVKLRSTQNSGGDITIEADGGTSETIYIHSDQGTSATEGAASIQLLSDVGGINLKSGLNASNSIRLTADGGTSESILLHADQGTGAASIHLASDAGGITMTLANDVTLDTDGKLYLNETADSNITTGISINQGAATDDVMSFKGSYVDQPMTGVAEADTFGQISVFHGTGGGLKLSGYSELGYFAGGIRGYAGAAPNEVKTASGLGIIHMDTFMTDGSTGTTAPTGNDNLFAVTVLGSAAKFIVDATGDIFIDGATTAFDSEDDISLLRAVQKSVAPDQVITQEFDKFLNSNEDDLIRLGILGGKRQGVADEDRGLLCLSKLTQLLTGGVVQLYEKIIDRDKRIEALENKVLAIGG